MKQSETVPTTGPSTDHLWTKADIAQFVGFASVDEFIARHDTFPTPVPFRMHGFRWRPADVIGWVDSLCEAKSAADNGVPDSVPTFDVDAYMKEHDNASAA